MNNPLTTHPHKHGMSYWYHLGYATGLGMVIIGLGCLTLVHALLPFMFEYTTSRTINRLHILLSSRRPTCGDSTTQKQSDSSATDTPFP